MVNSLNFQLTNELLKPSQPTFQRQINVVSTLWINVEITLMRRWKWNKNLLRIFNFVQRWLNVSAWPWNNVETTLHNIDTTFYKRCFNVASTLVKAISNPIELLIIMNLQIDEVFPLLNEKKNLLTTQLLIKYYKIL